MFLSLLSFVWLFKSFVRFDASNLDPSINIFLLKKIVENVINNFKIITLIILDLSWTFYKLNSVY